MKNGLCGALTLAFGLFFATGATAGVAFNGSLANGFYNGIGGQNAGFTVFTDDTKTLELGLSAIIRYSGPAPEIGDNYYVPAGPTTVSGKSGPAWGISLSVDTRANGIGTASLSDYAYKMFIWDTTTSAFLGVFDPFNQLPDNTKRFVSGVPVGFQNSAPLSIIPAFNVNAYDGYAVVLTATKDGAIFQDSILINAQETPEPATYGLIGSALLALSLLGSRRLRRNK